MDLIDRQVAIDAAMRLSLGETDATRLAMRIRDYLERLQSARPEILACGEGELNAQPERKNGRWIKMSDADGVYWACSECGEELMRIWHYDAQFDLFPRLKSIDRTKHCPNCGADMREDT